MKWWAVLAFVTVEAVLLLFSWAVVAGAWVYAGVIAGIFCAAFIGPVTWLVALVVREAWAGR